MELKLSGQDKFRITADRELNFVDVTGLPFEAGLTVDAYPRFHYIEIRKKDGLMRIFFFKNKGIKKHLDLGWWTDAEVVYSINEVLKRAD